MRASKDRLGQFVRWTIEDEWPRRESFLSGEELRAFSAYYERLPRAGDEPMIQRYLRAFGRSESGWAARWIERRTARGERPRVLDAGSGFGTYAMLYAHMGADVVGADLRPDRLAAAERRLAFHAERTGERLSVRYDRADLTREWDSDYDLVWVYNAISHIDPLDGFLERVRRYLRPGGVFVVGDINGGRPEHLRRLAEIRTEIHQEYVAPDGERHKYAVERPFRPAELREVVVAAGLRVVHQELFWGGMGALPGPLYGGVLRPIQKLWWLGGRIARRQLLVATPGGGAA